MRCAWATQVGTSRAQVRAARARGGRLRQIGRCAELGGFMRGASALLRASATRMLRAPHSLLAQVYTAAARVDELDGGAGAVW